MPGMSTARFIIASSTQCGSTTNGKRQLPDDPRVRRALHLICDKQVLVDVVKDVSPLMVGGFIYPFSEFATPKDQLVKRIGYQDDSAAAIAEAKSLLAAAGQENGMRTLDFMGTGPQSPQAVRHRHPGDAADGEHPVQSANGCRIGVVR